MTPTSGVTSQGSCDLHGRGDSTAPAPAQQRLAPLGSCPDPERPGVSPLGRTARGQNSEAAASARPPSIMMLGAIHPRQPQPCGVRQAQGVLGLLSLPDEWACKGQVCSVPHSVPDPRPRLDVGGPPRPHQAGQLLRPDLLLRGPRLSFMLSSTPGRGKRGSFARRPAHTRVSVTAGASHPRRADPGPPGWDQVHLERL